MRDASAHLRDALSYCCDLPWSEVRMRFFCFTSLIFAARTLTLIERRRDDFVRGHRIKMSRGNVYALLGLTFFITPFNPLLRLVFRGVTGSSPAVS
jgi:TRAP-type mannitol/chloroaromatic compound transport system permease small subunit